MASNAGLNRVYTVALQLQATSGLAAVASPLTTYGTTGINDSGAIMFEAMNFTNWMFSLIPGAGGSTTGYTISCYGTSDPIAVAQWRSSFNPQVPAKTIPASSWVLLDAPSTQAGTGTIANPMTSTSPMLIVKQPLLAVRVVLTAVSGNTAGAQVLVEATP